MGKWHVPMVWPTYQASAFEERRERERIVSWKESIKMETEIVGKTILEFLVTGIN